MRYAIGIGLGALFSFSLGWHLSSRFFMSKMYKPMEVSVLQQELLSYILETMDSDEYVDPEEFITSVNHKIDYINMVANV